jgi:hypothetical protein
LISGFFASESSLLCDPETADPFAGIFFLKICGAFFPDSARQFIRIFLRSVVLTGSGSIVDGACNHFPQVFGIHACAPAFHE